MAKFLDTEEIISGISRIIKKAEKKVYLVSPYMDIRQRYKELIEEKNEKGIPVEIIWGKKKKQLKFVGINKWIKNLIHVNDYYRQQLHAKCYLNEKEAIITSMNLYEASEKNMEIGVLITKKEDEEAYNDLFDEVIRILKSPPQLKKAEKQSYKEEKGFCIRCGQEIKLDPTHPYCDKDYHVWNKIRNKTYQEKNGVCHMCGKPNKSSLEKPVCINCYKKNKSLFKK